MSLTRGEAERIANLARLQVTDDEIDGLVQELSRILDFVDQLQAVDTGDVEPMAHPVNMAQALRPDRVTETDARDLYQRNAGCTEDGLYLVPRVIE